MTKNTGKVFEDAIKKSADSTDNLYYYRLKDSASSFNPTEGTGLRFTPSNDYDCFAYYSPNLFPMELKSGKGTSFSFQIDKKDSGKNIKLNQINGLLKASAIDGIYAGFLFNFSDKEKTYWMNIIDFYKFYQSTDKKSINESDIIEWNGILVESTLKKVNYSYNLLKMIKDITRKKASIC